MFVISHRLTMQKNNNNYSKNYNCLKETKTKFSYTQIYVHNTFVFEYLSTSKTVDHIKNFFKNGSCNLRDLNTKIHTVSFRMNLFGLVTFLCVSLEHVRAAIANHKLHATNSKQYNDCLCSTHYIRCVSHYTHEEIMTENNIVNRLAG